MDAIVELPSIISNTYLTSRFGMLCWCTHQEFQNIPGLENKSNDKSQSVVCGSQEATQPGGVGEVSDPGGLG